MKLQNIFTKQRFYLVFCFVLISAIFAMGFYFCQGLNGNNQGKEAITNAVPTNSDTKQFIKTLKNI